jgi:predicted MPP superfamily phosphohydrolase
MKLAWVSRRKFFLMTLLAAPSLVVADALKFEPGWIRTRKIRFGHSKPTHRFVHFTDLHHRGDGAYLKGVAEKINSLSPEFVCFTGDIIEETQFLPEALAIIRGIKSPVFGVPGNHDYWSGADFSVIAETFNATGGAWLLDRQVTTRDGDF